MRIVICADAHLDSVFSVFKKNSSKLSMRREEQKRAFSKAISEAERIGAHMLMIPGDLLDARNVSKDTIEFLKDSFRSVPETFVLIAPGNHDPVTPDSPYVTEEWPDNVYIFKKGLEALELSYEDTGETVRIYGAGFHGHFCRSSLLRYNNILPILDRNVLNLLVMHGNITDPGGRSDYNPIYKDDIDACGFDFCALGHSHRYSGTVRLKNTAYVYPGTCEGRSFDETDTCGILSGTVTKNGAELDFIPTSVRENHVCDIDITGIDTYAGIADAIRSVCREKEWLYKVTLKGSKHPDLHLPVGRLAGELSDEYFYIKIIPDYIDSVNITLLKDENSLRGCFVRSMLERMEAASPDEKEMYTKALAYGLQAFDGEVNFNDYT